MNSVRNKAPPPRTCSCAFLGSIRDSSTTTVWKHATCVAIVPTNMLHGHRCFMECIIVSKSGMLMGGVRMFTNPLRQREKINATRAGESLLILVRGASMVLRLPIIAILLFLQPIVGFVLCGFSIILAVVAVILKFAGTPPSFPFWGMLGVSAACFALYTVYAGIVLLLAHKPDD